MFYLKQLNSILAWNSTKHLFFWSNFSQVNFDKWLHILKNLLNNASGNTYSKGDQNTVIWTLFKLFSENQMFRTVVFENKKPKTEWQLSIVIGTTKRSSFNYCILKATLVAVNHPPRLHDPPSKLLVANIRAHITIFLILTVFCNFSLSQHVCEACGQTIPSAKDTPGPSNNN